MKESKVRSFLNVKPWPVLLVQDAPPSPTVTLPILLPLCLALIVPESSRNVHTFVPFPLWIPRPGSLFPLLGELLLDRQNPMQMSPLVHDTSSNHLPLPQVTTQLLCFCSVFFILPLNVCIVELKSYVYKSAALPHPQ